MNKPVTGGVTRSQKRAILAIGCHSERLLQTAYIAFPEIVHRRWHGGFRGSCLSATILPDFVWGKTMKLFILLFSFCLVAVQSSPAKKMSDREHDGFIGPVKSV